MTTEPPKRPSGPPPPPSPAPRRDDAPQDGAPPPTSSGSIPLPSRAAVKAANGDVDAGNVNIGGALSETATGERAGRPPEAISPSERPRAKGSGKVVAARTPLDPAKARALKEKIKDALVRLATIAQSRKGFELSTEVSNLFRAETHGDDTDPAIQDFLDTLWDGELLNAEFAREIHTATSPKEREALLAQAVRSRSSQTITIATEVLNPASAEDLEKARAGWVQLWEDFATGKKDQDTAEREKDDIEKAANTALVGLANLAIDSEAAKAIGLTGKTLDPDRDKLVEMVDQAGGADATIDVRGFTYKLEDAFNRGTYGPVANWPAAAQKASDVIKYAKLDDGDLGERIRIRLGHEHPHHHPAVAAAVIFNLGLESIVGRDDPVIAGILDMFGGPNNIIAQARACGMPQPLIPALKLAPKADEAKAGEPPADGDAPAEVKPDAPAEAKPDAPAEAKPDAPAEAKADDKPSPNPEDAEAFKWNW